MSKLAISNSYFGTFVSKRWGLSGFTITELPLKVNQNTEADLTLEMFSFRINSARTKGIDHGIKCLFELSSCSIRKRFKR